MIPIGDDNPTLRTPVATYTLLALTLLVWVGVQGAGDPAHVVQSVCNLGLVPAELTHLRPVGYAVPIAPGVACVVDDSAVNWLTPVLTIFLHGSWGHLLGNSLYLWIFGNNVEDSMGRVRFVVFYLLCGVAAAATHVAFSPASAIPTVGASGAISGVMGAYLVLYPHARVRIFFPPFFLFRVVAWVVLIFWFGTQVVAALPQFNPVDPAVDGGVAVWAHVGGFVAGLLLVKLFEDRTYVRRRLAGGDAARAFGDDARGRFG